VDAAEAGRPSGRLLALSLLGSPAWGSLDASNLTHPKERPMENILKGETSELVYLA